MSFGFYFKDFSPREELESYANVALSRVMDMAPYGATVSAIIEQLPDGNYGGHIEICSTWGPFFASVRGLDPKMAIDKLLERMQEKLQTWHSRRFYGQPQPDMPILTQ